MDPVNTSWIFSTIILIGVIMLLIFFLCIVVFLYNQNQSKLKKMKASTISLNQEIISLRKNNNEAWIIINRQQRKLRDQRNSEARETRTPNLPLWRRTRYQLRHSPNCIDQWRALTQDIVINSIRSLLASRANRADCRALSPLVASLLQAKIVTNDSFGHLIK